MLKPEKQRLTDVVHTRLTARDARRLRKIGNGRKTSDILRLMVSSLLHDPVFLNKVARAKKQNKR